MKATTFDDHDDRASKVQQVLKEFVHELNRRQCTSHFERVFDGKHLLHGKSLVQEPERFTEDHLVFPILRALGHQIRPRPKQYAPRWPLRSGVPDFALETIPIETAKDHDMRLFGEAKPPNKLDYAREQMYDYLEKDLDLGVVVIITDGLDWELWYRTFEMSDPQLGGETSVQEALERTTCLNKEGVEYRPFYARKALDEVGLASLSAEGLYALLDEEFEIDPFSLR